MATTTVDVHVVAKTDVTDHHVTKSSLPSLPSLDKGHVRVRSLLLGLTSNNMAYATNGTRLHWWDAYPVPSDLPAPFNDHEKYGIVPCWGYGEVLESTIDEIDAGRLVFGLWPSSQVPVDLQLVPTAVKDHWIDVAPQRKEVMNLYRRFVLAESSLGVASLNDGRTFEWMARRANVGVLYEAGYLLNTAVFGETTVHPLGEAAGEWSAEDGDLSAAVIVSLSGSGRTARSFTDNIFHERRRAEGDAAAGPLAFLAITSNPGAGVFRQRPIPTRIASYSEIASPQAYAWISSHRAKKIIVVDFGGRDDAFDALFSGLQSAFPDLKVTAIGVGAEAKAHTAEYRDRFARRNALPNRTMMNTTALRDAMMKRMGEEEYFRRVDRAWERSVGRGCMEDMVSSFGEGIEGEKGFDGGWEELSRGQLPGDRARVYRV